MKKANKKDSWTNDKWYKHYRNQYIWCFIAELLSLIIPLATLMISKKDIYFKHTGTIDTVKFSFGGIMIVAVIVLIIIQHFKKSEDTRVKMGVSLLTIGLGYGVIVCFSVMFQDLVLIGGIAMASLVVSFVFYCLEVNRKHWADDYRKGLVTAKTIKNKNESPLQVHDDTRAVD